VVFDLDNGELITDKYWHLHLPITDGCTYFAYFNETKNGILTKRTAFVEKKPEILAMLSAEIAARFLNFSAETQEFGATIAYLAGCIFENMVPKLESYTELKQYLKGGKKESDVYTRKLSTKRLDILMEKLNENLLEKKEEKVEKKDIITSRFLSDVINTGLIFTVVPVSIILDKDLEDKIPVKIISIEGIRGGLVFITDDLKIFRSGANTDILFKLKNLTKMENISLIYRNFEY
jgi:hypothetical protein